MLRPSNYIHATTAKQDYYELLGVPRKAGGEVIRAAFRSWRGSITRI